MNESKTELTLKEETGSLYPLFHKYNPDIHIDDVVSLLNKEKVRPPSGQVVCGFICEINGKIVGFTCLLVNHFVDCLIVDKDLPLVTRVRILDTMMDCIGGVAMYLGIKKLYFATEVGGDRFVNYMQRRFKVKEFTTTTIYTVEV